MLLVDDKPMLEILLEQCIVRISDFIFCQLLKGADYQLFRDR